jgi:tetratricopeptide (TPR) repeat protein
MRIWLVTLALIVHGAPVLGQVLPPSPSTPPPASPPDEPALTVPPAAEAATPPQEPLPRPATAPARPQLSIPEVLVRIQAMMDAGAHADALNALNAVLRLEPEHFDARLLLAKLHETRGDYMNARTAYLELVKLQPNNFDVNLGLGRIFVRLQYWRQVPRYLEAADRVARPDQKAEVKILLALAFRGAGDREAALKAAMEAVAADPQNIIARHTLVDARIGLEQYEEAAGDAQTLVELAVREVEAKRGNPDPLRRLSEAQDALLDVLRRHFTTLHLRDAAGRHTDQLLPGREKEAAAALQRIVDVLLRIAEVRRALAQHDALLIAAKASSLDPTNTSALHNEALLLLNTDQRDAAIAKFQRILELEPDNPDAVRELTRLNAPLTSQPAASQPVAMP